MFDKRALGLLVILVTFATSASSQTQEQTGTIRVTVQVAGTQTPLSGILVSIAPCPNCLVSVTPCQNCERDKIPETEADLLAYLMALAKARGLPVSAAYPNGVPPDPKLMQAAFTNGEGSILFEKIGWGTYRIIARKPSPLSDVPGQTASVVISVGADNSAPTPVLYLSAPPNK